FGGDAVGAARIEGVAQGIRGVFPQRIDRLIHDTERELTRRGAALRVGHLNAVGDVVAGVVAVLGIGCWVLGVGRFSCTPKSWGARGAISCSLFPDRNVQLPFRESDAQRSLALREVLLPNVAGREEDVRAVVR